LHRQQVGTQALAVAVQSQGAGDAAAEGLMEDEVEGVKFGQLITVHAPSHGIAQAGLHPLCSDLSDKHAIVRSVVGDDRNVGDVALVAGARVGQSSKLHQEVSRLTFVSAWSRSIKADVMAMTG